MSKSPETSEVTAFRRKAPKASLRCSKVDAFLLPSALISLTALDALLR